MSVVDQIHPLPAPEPKEKPKEKEVSSFSARGAIYAMGYYLTKAGRAAADFVTRPVLAGTSNCNLLSSATEPPDSRLRTIDTLAHQGLRTAALRNALGTDASGKLHAEFDGALKARTEIRGPEAVVEIRPVPNIGDPEITRAPPLKELAKAIDWQAEREKQCDALCKEVSALTALVQMRKLAGIAEKHNVDLQRMAGLIAKPGETRSLWQIFAEHYHLSLWQKLCAGFAYWFYYQTSLISNTVNAYVEAFIRNLQADLTTPDSRSKFIRILLEQANEFWVEDRRATEAFARSITPGEGDLEKMRRKAIDAHYGGDLAKLCAAFTKKRVEEDSPKVRFFRDLQKIPGLGRIAYLLEWAINRFLIQKIMKSMILPSALESAIKDGVKATEPDNIAFSLAVTRFLNSQLEKLLTKLTDKENPPSQPKVLPGTELLPTVVKNLMLVLDLDSFQTQPELRCRLKEIEEKPWFIDKLLQDTFQDGITTGGHYLLEYLDQSANSGELFANLLELSRAPFLGQPIDHAILLAEYSAEQKKLHTTTRNVAETIIQNALTELVGNDPSRETVKDTETVFASAQRVLKRTLEELHTQCREMEKKILNEGRATDEKNSVQNDIASSLQLLQVLATRSELREHIMALPVTEREAVWRSLNPLLEQASQLQEAILRLQEHQDDYSTHKAISLYLQTIQGHTDFLLQQLLAQPNQFSNSLSSTLLDLCDKVSHSLGARAPAVIHLKERIQKIASLSKSISDEQQTLQALFALCPFNENGNDSPIRQKGLLQQLLDHEVGASPPGFQPGACGKEMDRQLTLFAENAKDEANQLRALLRKNTPLSEKREELLALLQQIWERHTALKKRDVQALQQVLQTTTTWAGEKGEKYSQVKDSDYEKMQKQSQEISADAALLYLRAKEMQLNLPFSLTSGQVPLLPLEKKTAMGALVGAGAGVALVKGVETLGSALGGDVGGQIGSALGAGLSLSSIPGAYNASGLLAKDRGAIAKTVASLAIGTFLSYWAPGWSTLVGGAMSLAWTGVRWREIAHKNAKAEASPRAKELLGRAINHLFSPRIYWAAATRGLQTMTEA